MPRKQATINDSSAAAAPARAAKPKAPRVKSAKHAKAAAPETAAPETEALVESAIEIEVVAAELEPVAVLTDLAIEPDPVAIFFTQEPESIPEPTKVKQPAAAVPVSVSSEAAREEIARIAYGYWDARGHADGNPVEDWVRAEDEYRRQHAV